MSTAKKPAQKTLPTDVEVDAYLAAIPDEARRADCIALTELMRRVTGCEPRMWGTGIVGFGSYHYKYDSGREGDSCLVGFASRKGDISLYLMAGFEQREALLARLGKHKAAKACLYVKHLADVDAGVLAELIADSVQYLKEKYDA